MGQRGFPSFQLPWVAHLSYPHPYHHQEGGRGEGGLGGTWGSGCCLCYPGGFGKYLHVHEYVQSLSLSLSTL